MKVTKYESMGGFGYYAHYDLSKPEEYNRFRQNYGEDAEIIYDTEPSEHFAVTEKRLRIGTDCLKCIIGLKKPTLKIIHRDCTAALKLIHSGKEPLFCDDPLTYNEADANNNLRTAIYALEVLQDLKYAVMANKISDTALHLIFCGRSATRSWLREDVKKLNKKDRKVLVSIVDFAHDYFNGNIKSGCRK